VTYDENVIKRCGYQFFAFYDEADRLKVEAQKRKVYSKQDSSNQVWFIDDDQEKANNPPPKIVLFIFLLLLSCVSFDLKLDFWAYNVFPENIFQRLTDHHEEIQQLNLKSVKRGSQFQFYSEGEMFSRGARAPMGGLPGDAYTMYAGMDAIDCEGINILFNDAEVYFYLDF
jgi:hypothetical protein